ncbi:FecR domain-containing protein [Chitinophaga horti]|uniref:FecR domain-containing protein n=1 Tax=Chitinophaga horti TaxID=2920382 RepID=A0ABY6J7U4_9BACT|nr:FecR domain-containing protein [Chitinophaga horti]UYQ95765.1 FecR domain-containing protein [Chitinophaga horti]
MPVFEQLFSKYLKGETSAQEEQELFDQIAQPENNDRLLQLIDQAIAGSGDEHQANKADEILSLILEARPAKRVKVFTYMKWAAAALVAGAIGVGAWMYTKQPTTPPQLATQQPQQNDIAPASKGALLTLADGTTVPLDSLKQGVIASQHGASISLDKGTVSYSGQSTDIAMNTLSTPNGRLYHLVLPDGSEVWLNAGSAITFPTSFSGNERRVSLKGEAYFEIAESASQPFKVQAGASEVQVLGTGFNIMAYENEAAVKTTLVHGSIAVAAGSSSRILKPGQQASVTTNGIMVQQADVSQVMAWKNGLFNFENATVKDVMNQLERWYDIEVVYENGVPDITFGGKMERGLSLSHVMRILEISKVKLRLEQRRLIVTK